MYKTFVIAAVAIIIVGGVSFYSGMSYAKNQIPVSSQRGQFGARGNRTGMGGFTAGEVLSKDATSVTVKMQDGSTKIVLFGSSTQVMKATTGTLQDLFVGVSIVVNGSSNGDGSVTAQNIQIRPAGILGPASGGLRSQ